MILNKRNMQILCRLCADTRKTFFAYILCCHFVGCIIMQNRRGVVFMHHCCKNDTKPGNVTYLSHFLQSIENISVSLCCKNNDLVSKTVQIRQDSRAKAAPCESHPPLPSTYIYTNTQKWYFKGWHNVAYTKKYAWHGLISGYNCGAGAGS